MATHLRFFSPCRVPAASFTRLFLHSSASKVSAADLPPLPLRRSLRSKSMSTTAHSDPAKNEKPVGGGDEEVIVQYVVLRRDLIDAWPMGSVVTQGCHAVVVSPFSYVCVSDGYLTNEDLWNCLCSRPEDKHHQTFIDFGLKFNKSSPMTN